MSGPEDTRVSTYAERVSTDLRYPGEPCMCNRINGTLGYQTPEDCPACDGTGVTIRRVPPKGALGS